MIEAVLFDVGGTLWPNAARGSGEERLAAAASRLADALALADEDALVLADRLTLGAEGELGEVQDTAGIVAATVTALGWNDRGVALEVAQRSMCHPALSQLDPFAGARELLDTARDLQLRVAIVSNAVWRDAVAYRQDFVELRLGEADVYVSSVDVGYRKPNVAMFRAALDALRVDAGAAVMVGDSEVKDIIPAKALGMRTVRVAIEEPPTATVADALCTSLAEVRAWLLRNVGP